MSLENAPRDPAAKKKGDAGMFPAFASWKHADVPIFSFERIGCTMDEAHRLAQKGLPEGTLVLALRQEQGRGRLGRVWSSPEGGLYLSLILRPSRQATEIPQLSLIAGLAVAEAIRERAGLFPSIRWPNDLLIEGKKVAGILVEAKSVRSSGLGVGGSRQTPQTTVILGIGINVTTRLQDLPPEATSLAAARGETPDALDLWDLVSALCRRLEAWYDVWTAQGFAPIREALRLWIGLFGQVVHVTAGSSVFEGTAADLDEQGRLVVRLDSGVLRTFEAGEVTLLREDRVRIQPNDSRH